MKSKITIFLTFAFIATLLNSCKKDDTNPDTSKYTIYVAGIYDLGKGCYWKNGNRTDFGSAYMVTGMAVNNGDVYVSGCLTERYACYWENGVRIDLPDYSTVSEAFAAVYAYGIYATGSDVYTVGRYNTGDEPPFVARVQPCYWKNTTCIDITDYPDRFAEASCIYVSNGDVYIGGKYDVPVTGGAPIEETQACYWKNGLKTDLPGENSFVNDIFVENGKVYAVGGYIKANNPPFDPDNPPSFTISCFWIDGEKVDIVGKSVHAKAIFVDNGTVYIAGHCILNDYFHACYWKDNKQTTLESRTTASSIFVKDGIVFTCGSFSENRTNDNKYQSFPCYWANTKRTELSVTGDLRDTDFNDAVGIFVE